MQKIKIIYTKRNFNPISWLIRWAIPRSRFSMALSSHCMLVDGDFIIEAHMLHGVRRVLATDALKGLTVIKTVDYVVEKSEAGLNWACAQVGAPYDWLGAFGIAIDIDRNWQKPDAWFCYELVAAALVAAGKDAFADTGHITGTTLLSIKP